MKSLNVKSQYGCPYDHDIFTKEIMDHILEEEFTFEHSKDSYASMDDYGTYDSELSDSAYFKSYYSDVDIFIYIRNKRVEVDIDMSCGGNLRVAFWEFNSPKSFEEAYDKMVDFVNEYR